MVSSDRNSDARANDSEQAEADQNYPNPFNPTTKVTFSISQRSNVILSVCDVEGRELLRPVSGVYEAGEYTAVVDGHSLASGIYFCMLRAGGINDVRKMVVMK